MARFTDEQETLTYARRQWEDGEDRVRRFSHDSRRRQVFEDVIEHVEDELERRVGQSFSTIELIDQYARAEDWCADIARGVAPEDPWAWDLSIVLDASFHRFSRRARDWQVDES